MPVIRLETKIKAPIERVFDLARSIDLHTRSASRSNEKAIAGRTSGLIGPGETVTWEATHLFVRQTLTSRIVAFDRPRHFRDQMQRGAFTRLVHDHFFEELKEGTLMRDVFDFDSPLGIFGRLADRLFLKRYMTRFLRERNALIREIAETDRWKDYL